MKKILNFILPVILLFFISCEPANPLEDYVEYKVTTSQPGFKYTIQNSHRGFQTDTIFTESVWSGGFKRPSGAPVYLLGKGLHDSMEVKVEIFYEGELLYFNSRFGNTPEVNTSGTLP